MEPQIQFCTSSDATQLAYAAFGEGFPLVQITSWGSTIEGDREYLDAAGFVKNVAAGRRLVLYDRRGTGASQRNVNDFSMDAQVADLSAIVEHLRLEQFDIFGGSEGAAIASVYAAQHPNRVRKLVFFSAYSFGPDLAPKGSTDALAEMMLQNWSLARRAIADIVYPDGPTEMQKQYARKLGRESSPETAAECIKFAHALDVMAEMRQIAAPTLVIHRRGDRNVPIDAGRAVASLIPNARFLGIEGTNPGWYTDNEHYADAVREFLSEGEAVPIAQPQRPATSDTHTILFTDMEASTALTQRLGDAGAQEVRRAHNEIVRSALQTHSGSEIKHTGDGIMASFTTASSALESAIAIQQGVAAHVERQPDSPLAVYIGLNAGEPIAEDQDLFGTSVDLAARICEQAQPGQILASDVVRQLATGKQFLFADLGETALRGFEDPVKLWEVRWQSP